MATEGKKYSCFVIKTRLLKNKNGKKNPNVNILFLKQSTPCPPFLLSVYNTRTHSIKLGKFLGSGMDRVVYRHPLNKNLVVKVARWSSCGRGRYNGNRKEFTNYKDLISYKGESIRRYLVPIRYISDDDAFLIQHYIGNERPSHFQCCKTSDNLEANYRVHVYDTHTGNFILDKKTNKARIVDLGHGFCWL